MAEPRTDAIENLSNEPEIINNRGVDGDHWLCLGIHPTNAKNVMFITVIIETCSYSRQTIFFVANTMVK